MEGERSTLNAPRLFLGLVVVTLGLIALLDNLGVIQVESAWRFWPLFLIAFGTARLLRPAGCPGRWTGFMLVVIGLWLLLQNLGLMPYRLIHFWPVLIVLVGLRLVWGGMTQRAREAASPTDGAARISSFAMLGGSEHKSTAVDFRGGDITAILGGSKIDLRNASLKSGDAVIDTFAMWGGIEIIVPRTWSVSVQGTPILGAYEDKTDQHPDTGGPRLVVRGVVIMGGVEIKN